MNKTDLVDRLAKKTGMTKARVEELLAGIPGILDVYAESLEKIEALGRRVWETSHQDKRDERASEPSDSKEDERSGEGCPGL